MLNCQHAKHESMIALSGFVQQRAIREPVDGNRQSYVLMQVGREGGVCFGGQGAVHQGEGSLQGGGVPVLPVPAGLAVPELEAVKCLKRELAHPPARKPAKVMVADVLESILALLPCMHPLIA